MKIMNLKERKEDAVSPVIGVMLMLVVTIVIAAVVAAFAGGITTDTEPTPSVVLSADVYPKHGDAAPKVVLQSLSGDRLEISKLVVNVYKEDGGLISAGTLSTGQDTYFTPGEILTFNLAESTDLESGKTVLVVVTSNEKHTVFNKEVIVKA